MAWPLSPIQRVFLRGQRFVVAIVWVACVVCAVHPAWAVRPNEMEASIVAKQAIDYYKNGNPLMAAELYRRAFRLDPAKPDYLFGVGRAEEKAGRAKEAIAAYENVVALLPNTDPLVKKAQQALMALRVPEAHVAAPPPPAEHASGAVPQRPVVAESAPPPVAKPVAAAAVVAPPPASSVVLPPAAVKPVEPRLALAPVPEPKRDSPADWHKPVGWSLVATSGAAAVTAAVLAVLAAKNQSDLTGFKTDSGLYDPARITSADVRQRQTSINSMWTGAAVTGGLAVAAAGVGAWALLSAPKSSAAAVAVSVTPGPGDLGVALAGRF